MTASTQPIFPKSPVIGIATLTAATPLMSRANITGTAGLTQLTPTSTDGKRVDTIRVKAKSTSVASNLFIWLYNGTTAFLLDEIDIAATAAGNSSDSFSFTRSYADLVLPPAYQLFVSQTIQTDLNVFAMGGDY